MRIAAITHRGLCRDENQDRIVIDGVVLGSGARGTAELDVGALSLLAVIDGMGGHPAGGVAAAVAADVMASGFQQLRTADDVEALVSAANDELYAMMGRVPGLGGMGATIAGVFTTPDHLVIFNVGDARVYLHSCGYLMQATVDDRRAGTSNGPVTQSLGGLCARSPVDVHVTIEPHDGDSLLVASDGLFSRVPHGRLAQAMSAPVATAARQLLDAALATGGHDNISLALLELC